MKLIMEVEIFEGNSDHTLFLDNEDASFNIDVDPSSKTYLSRMSLKYDVYYRTQKYEYKINTEPIRVETRLIERVDEPPERYSVRDGVVLEADILTDRGGVASSMTKEFISDLKQETVWHEGWVGDPITMYLLSLHPEVISTKDFRRYLRGLSENIKLSTQKVQKAIEGDATGIQVTDEYEGSGRTVWYPKSKQAKMSETEMDKAIDYQHSVNERLFNKKSKEYVGISQNDFKSSVQIIKTIDVFLNKKKTTSNKIEGSTISFGVKIGAFFFQWIWLFFVVSVSLWLFSMIITDIQYDLTFALLISVICYFVLLFLKSRNK